MIHLIGIDATKPTANSFVVPHNHGLTHVVGGWQPTTATAPLPQQNVNNPSLGPYRLVELEVTYVQSSNCSTCCVWVAVMGLI
ncbi:MAG: hypothetical protein LBF84_01580 [Holosporales bacterium]|nr:hypothetical protein [Holosporales bacterium]